MENLLRISKNVSCKVPLAKTFASLKVLICVEKNIKALLITDKVFFEGKKNHTCISREQLHRYFQNQNKKQKTTFTRDK